MNPSLAQVLESGTGSPLPPTLYLIAALATIFFAAVAANTYIRRKNRWMENIVEDCQNNTSVMENLEKQAATEKLEKLEFCMMLNGKNDCCVFYKLMSHNDYNLFYLTIKQMCFILFLSFLS